MQTNALKFALLAVCFLLPQPGCAQREVAAVITDDKGVTTSVAGLKARYEASQARWDGPTPSRETDDVRLLMTIKEGRVTTKEELVLPFRDLRRASFKFVDHHTGWLIRFERRDGSTVVIRHWRTLELADPGGKKQVRTVEDSDFAAGEVQHVLLLLEAFVGKAATSSGKQGAFQIPWRETSTIDFK